MEFQNYINGEWVGSSDGQTFEQRDPANLESVTGVWPKSTRDDARRALEAAHEAFPAWNGLGVHGRAEYLSRAVAVLKGRIDEVAAILTEENGKTLDEGRTEAGSAVKEMEFQINQGVSMCGETAPSAQQGVFAYSVRRPLGAVAIISPWNFPFNVPAEVHPGLDQRQHHRFQARQPDTQGGQGFCRPVRRGRVTTGGPEPRHGRRLDGG